MNFDLILKIGQAMFAVFLIGLVLLQGGGAGLSGGGSLYANYFSSKRGFDKYIFYATIVCFVLFGIFSIASIFI